MVHFRGHRDTANPGTAPGAAAGPVALTGATGFIGRRVQVALIDAGWAVRAIVQPGSRNLRHLDPRCQRVNCSLADPAGLTAALQGARAVVYCAGSVRGRGLADFLPANVDGVAAVLRAMPATEEALPFLLISSLAAGRPELSDYARSKWLGEAAVRKHATGPWTIIRPPAVYGPGDREMLPILKMLRSGVIVHAGPREQRASLLYVDDLATAVAAWLSAWRNCAGSTYAIDDGRPGGYDWDALAAAAGRNRYRRLRIPPGLLAMLAYGNLQLSRLTGRAPMLTPGKVRELTAAEWLCDNAPFAAATAWRPRIDLATGLGIALGGKVNHAP
jgi:2-alkyl-3-oxoalkanoate reductase